MSTGWPPFSYRFSTTLQSGTVFCQKKVDFFLKNDYEGKNGSTLIKWNRFSKWSHCGAILAPLFFQCSCVAPDCGLLRMLLTISLRCVYFVILVCYNDKFGINIYTIRTALRPSRLLKCCIGHNMHKASKYSFEYQNFVML